MLDMGIIDKEGLDLIMTHEGAHRMLQGSVSSLDLTPHQVELYCDYMAGVRAGLNGMDFTKMQNALCNLPECAPPIRTAKSRRNRRWCKFCIRVYAEAWKSSDIRRLP